MTIHTNRRSLLQGAAGIAAASVVAIAPAAAAIPPISPELARLIAERDAADAIVDRFYDEVFNPAVERNNAEVAAHRAKLAAIPHVTEYGGAALGGGPVTFCSSKGYSRTQALHFIECDEREPNRGGDWDKTIEAARRYIAAEDGRNAKIGALGDEPSFPADISAREDELLAPLDRLDKAIREYPSASLADLSAKLADIERRGFEVDGLLSIVQADVSRLSGKEA